MGPKLPNNSLVVVAVAQKALLSAIVLCLALQAWLALTTEINWDEFFYLSQIYSYQNGELTGALQTFHVHLLGWVTSVPGDEIDQVKAGRLIMLACETATSVLIYNLARTFFGPKGSLMAVLAFVSAGFTIIHGSSFRTDPLAATLLMGALVIIARSRSGVPSAIGGAALMALATMITVKAVLYAPAFVAVGAWRVGRSDDRIQIITWLSGMAVLAAAIFAMLYLVQLGLLPKASNAGSRTGLGNAAETQTGAGFLPRSSELVQFMRLSALQTLLATTGFVAAAVSLRTQRALNWDALAILGCGVTLLTVLFYRNAYPYFFPFIFAPAAILVGLAVQRIRLFSQHALLLVGGLLVPAVAVAASQSKHDQMMQKQLVSAVHLMFPKPVAYIDRNSMIASFPKRGLFMSTWGMANYRKGRPVFAGVLSHEVVPLLIVNGPALEHATGMKLGLPQDLQLFPEDEAVLRQNFVPYWGRIWVAGKRVAAKPGGTEISIAVPGVYTLDGGAALIDGKPVAVGSIVKLERGAHVIRSASPILVILRWGDHLYKPSNSPRAGPIYRGF